MNFQSGDQFERGRVRLVLISNDGVTAWKASVYRRSLFGSSFAHYRDEINLVYPHILFRDGWEYTPYQEQGNQTMECSNYEPE